MALTVVQDPDVSIRIEWERMFVYREEEIKRYTKFENLIGFISIKELQMLPKQISIFLALAAALALLPAGCGGGSDDGPTKAEFIKRAEAVCNKLHREQFRLAKKYYKTSGLEKEELPFAKSSAIVAKAITVPAILKEMKELKELESPKGEEEKVQEIFTKTEEGARKVEEHPSSVNNSGASNPLWVSFKMARGYGFQACAEF